MNKAAKKQFDVPKTAWDCLLSPGVIEIRYHQDKVRLM